MLNEIALDGLPINVREAIFSAADGCNEAVVILKVIHDNKHFIDSDCAWGIIEITASLIENGITGTKIPRMFNVICRRDYTRMLAILRARQLGDFTCLSREELIYAVENNGLGINLDKIIMVVDKTVTTFNKAPLRFS